MSDVKNKIIITGVYRSATTYLQKTMDANQYFHVQYQPLFEFFSLLEKKIWHEVYGKSNMSAIGENVYFDLYPSLDLMFTDLEIAEVRKNLHKNIVNSGANDSKMLLELISDVIIEKDLRGLHENFFDLFAVLAESKSSVEIVGYKDAFIHPYLPLLMDDATHLVMTMRDPREIYFSRNYVTEINKFGTLKRHPVIMVAMIWNSYVSVLRYLIEKGASISIVNYEDVCASTSSQIVSQISRDIGLAPKLKYDSCADSSTSWIINTSSDDNLPGYGRRWKNEMRVEHVAVIEHLCADGMRFFGYEPSLDPDEGLIVASKFKENFDDILPWAAAEKYSHISLT